ncbi:MAG TPA: beta-galactosidase [Tepidisphaeraceae bacterium]|nr:beta-galactosidase [Tepidisphaeraceae bacterium]
MPERFAPINPKFPHILHGGDYNPEQWLGRPEILDEDIRLMKLAHVNVATIGVFSWSMLEPSEGKFDFAWLDRVVEKLSIAQINFVLATPTGAKPNWMAMKYPEIRRCTPDGRRELQGYRHNHCYTSPVYREKAAIINTRLAERYGTQPSLLLWHISNEYGDECYCPLCKAAFREWLKNKYKTLDALNDAYWARFWSHTYTDWQQIDLIDETVHGLALDWKRFVTDQTVDFMKHEIAVIKKISPEIPVTTNMMGFYPVLNYWKFAPHLDVISWDSYPSWHAEESEAKTGASTGFAHDLNRSMKQKPFVLIESTPSVTNWRPVSPLKRPGMHRLSSLQAVAHGSDAVMYFQWRKGRGSCEKFHGAIVDHVGHENMRVFREVSALGSELEQMDAIVGTTTPAQVAIIYDWENRWMIDMEKGPRNLDKDYLRTCEEHYEPFWKRGVAVDVIDMEQQLSQYKLVVAPMLYMLRAGIAERIIQFVEAGGTFVATYFTGYVDENDLCFQSGFPGPLRNMFGIWNEEIDALPEGRHQTIVTSPGNGLGLNGYYKAKHFCELIHAEGAKPFATYGSDFYSGRPAATVNQFGKGNAYYIASRNDERFTDEFSDALIKQLKLRRAINSELPSGVTATYRTDGKKDWIFFMNFNAKQVRVAGTPPIELPPYGFHVLESAKIVR